jgi:hypothetical protein
VHLHSLRASGVVDHRGASHPAQDGQIGIELEPGAATRFVPAHGRISPAHWEVSATVLDNGRLRAEFDRAGRIVRLCWDGVFAQPASPWPGVSVIGDPPACAARSLDDPAIDAKFQVLEDGPVTAWVSFHRQLADGVLNLSYRLDAHADSLDVAVLWHGEGPLSLHHPGLARGAELECGDERARWSVPQAAHIDAGPAVVRELRHAALGNLCLAFPGPTMVSATDGDLRLTVDPDQLFGYTFLAATRPPEAPSRLQAALDQEGGHEAWSGPPRPSPLRPVLPPGMEALWWRGTATPRRRRSGGGASGAVRLPMADCTAGWDGEILISAQGTSRARGYLFPVHGRQPSAAARVDARGAVLAELPPTPEGDGWTLDLDPGELALLRWRCAAPDARR